MFFFIYSVVLEKTLPNFSLTKRNSQVTVSKHNIDFFYCKIKKTQTETTKLVIPEIHSSFSWKPDPEMVTDMMNKKLSHLLSNL